MPIKYRKTRYTMQFSFHFYEICSWAHKQPTDGKKSTANLSSRYTQPRLLKKWSRKRHFSSNQHLGNWNRPPPQSVIQPGYSSLSIPKPLHYLHQKIRPRAFYQTHRTPLFLRTAQKSRRVSDMPPLKKAWMELSQRNVGVCLPCKASTRQKLMPFTLPSAKSDRLSHEVS